MVHGNCEIIKKVSIEILELFKLGKKRKKFTF